MVPDQNEGTGEDGEVVVGISSHSVMAMEGMLPAEKLPRSISFSGLKAAGKLVSSDNCGGGLCQSKFGGVPAMMFWSIDSMPCIGAFTWAASCASNWCIRLSSAAWCSLHGGHQQRWSSRDYAIARLAGTHDATTSRGFCVRTHGNEKRLHVAHGVSPSHRIFLLLHRSQALETDLRRGCQSLTAVGEKRLGPSPAGNEAAAVVSGVQVVAGRDSSGGASY